MKKISIFILFFFLCKALSAATITSWDIPNNYLSNGSVYLPSTTTIAVDVYLTRGYGETGISLPFALGTTKSSGEIVLLSSLQTVTENDFEAYGAGSTYMKYTFTVSVNPTLVQNNKISLIWYPCCNTPAAFAGSYQTTTALMIGVRPPWSFQYGTTVAVSSTYNSQTFDYFQVSNTNLAGTEVNNIPGTKITMNNSQSVLVAGASIYSPNGNFRFTLQTDGNLVLYMKNSNGSETPTWASNTNGRASAALYFQTDGNLVIYPNGQSPLNPGGAIWASGLTTSNGFINITNMNNMPFYLLQDDGNLVFYWPTHVQIYDASQGGLAFTKSAILVFGATDTGSGNSPHYGSLNPVLWDSSVFNGVNYATGTIGATTGQLCQTTALSE